MTAFPLAHLRPISVNLLLATFLAASASGNADEPTLAGIPAPAERWCRVSFQLQKPAGDAKLVVTAPGTASIYLNGQRLARDLDLTGRALRVPVGSLLRKGRNCCAVTVSPTDPKSPSTFGISVGLTMVPEALIPSAAWRTTGDVPPVGWQTTDFNDRDWKTAQPVSFGPLPGNRTVVQSTWTAEPAHTRVKDEAFAFRDGDHVVLLGGTFIERAAQFGHLESALLQTAPGKRVTFRNMGWSADTVFAESRGIFDSPQRGYERLIEHVRAEEPDVIIVCYGQNEAMTFAQSESGRQRFRDQLGVLHNDLTSTGAEIVYVSSHPFLKLDPPRPDATRWNTGLAEVNTVVRDFTEANNSLYVDIFTDFVPALEAAAAVINPRDELSARSGRHTDRAGTPRQLWTANGMHWNAEGYRHVAAVLAARISGRPIVDSLLPHTDYEQLRQLVIRKNELYFHRWRPQNITYLFGFRKHEQGNNAGEIAQFDPLIANLEDQIHTARGLMKRKRR